MPAENITLPLADVRALVALAWELSNYISETDKSATGSIYGVQYAHKTIARVAVQIPEAYRECADGTRIEPARHEGTHRVVHPPGKLGPTA